MAKRAEKKVEASAQRPLTARFWSACKHPGQPSGSKDIACRTCGARVCANASKLAELRAFMELHGVAGGACAAQSVLAGEEKAP